MRKASEKFVSALVMYNGLGDHGAECRHAMCQPLGNSTTVKGKIGTTGSSCHEARRLKWF